MPNATKLHSEDFSLSAEQERTAKTLAPTIERFFKTSGRSFPWRDSRSVFDIAIAEILLQRTRADTAARVYCQLVGRYETPEKMLLADDSEVLSIISSLGLHTQRLRRLQEVARKLANDGDIATLADRRGRHFAMRRYLQDAVRCFAGGEHIAVVDANVIRVISRLYGTTSKTSRYISAAEARRIDALATAAARYALDARAYNFGLLDFAATICKPTPLCAKCPLASQCSFYTNLRPPSETVKHGA
jgi:A/G-specific adenine glycosylase